METSMYPTILCCSCGTPIQSNPSNMCLQCLQSNVNITENLKAEGSILFCKHCERYLNPPKFWVECTLESKELLSICLKHIRGLSKVHLIDASFVWTEPHSKRLKVKVTVQKEIFPSGSSGLDNTAIQQCAIIEFTVAYQMCDYCQKVAQNQEIWTAAVQIRQRVDHKKTFLFLEQAILKNDMHTNCTRVSEEPDGLDFYFGHRGHAQTLINFISTLAPIQCRTAEEMISHDTKNNVAEVHHTFAVEIAPICKDDLVCLPQKYSSSMGGLGPFTLCLKTNSAIVLVDPATCRMGQIPGSLYWKSPFPSVVAVRQAIEFYVMDIEIIDRDSNKDSSSRKFQLAEAQVCRANEVGQGNVFCVKTHLGNSLHVGDSALGYFLSSINANSDELKRLKRSQLPDVILIKRYHPKSGSVRSKYELKELQKVQKRDPRKSELSQREKDRQEFMEDLVEDQDMRAQVNLYKRKKDTPKSASSSNPRPRSSQDEDEDDMDSENEAIPAINEEDEDDQGEEDEEDDMNMDDD